MKFINTFTLRFLIAGLGLILPSAGSYASSQDEAMSYDTVIATWQPRHESIAHLNEAEKILTSSRYLTAGGDERERVTRFTNRLRNNFDTLNAGQKERLIILEARLLQGVHKFEQAKQHLSQITHYRSPAAQLLLADINIQQGNTEQAKHYCEQLVGQTSFLIAFTCMVNADFSENKDAKLLEKLNAFETYTSAARPDEKQWFYEVLADMSLQLGNAEEAIRYLNQTAFNALPISALLVWAEAHFKLGEFDTITNTLAAAVSDISTVDDGLLLKWAKAERAQGITSSNVQSRLAKNMEIRVWREDSSHAAQVATYFLEVQPNYALALKFAKLNWEYAQTNNDKQLFERAQKAVDA